MSDYAEVYDCIAPQFSSTRSYLWADIKPLAAYAKSGDRALDIGCGNGRLLHLFKGKKIFCTGVDQSAALLEIARQKFPGEEFIVADMRELPFSDGAFDAVFCIAAFHHLSDEASRLRTLREMGRTAKPDGRIVMTNWNLHSDWAEKKYGGGENSDFVIPWKDGAGKVLAERYYHAFVAEEMARLCKKVGLKILEQYYLKKGRRSDAEKGENLVTIISQ